MTPPYPGSQGCIQIHVQRLEQLFNSIDPSPFHSRDLDEAAHDYIIKSARELPKRVALALRVHLDEAPADSAQVELVGQAINTHFQVSSESAEAELRDLLRRGRISLVIGLAFLSSSIGLSQWLGAQPETTSHVLRMVQEGVVIGGWVAMWRPMEIFLYDWWPLAARIRLLRRLAKCAVWVQLPTTSLEKEART